MSKSIKLKNNTYWDSSGIVYNKHLLSDELQKQDMNVNSNMNEKKWQKICNIKFDKHTQGEFVFMKIFIGRGNNGRVDQNAYIDLIMQLGWTGNLNGRFGCNAELHPFNSGFTTSNTELKVIANSNIDYDIWFKNYVEQYCKPNYIINTSKSVLVTPKSELSDTEPTGTECNLSYISV